MSYQDHLIELLREADAMIDEAKEGSSFHRDHEREIAERIMTLAMGELILSGYPSNMDDKGFHVEADGSYYRLYGWRMGDVFRPDEVSFIRNVAQRVIALRGENGEEAQEASQNPQEASQSPQEGVSREPQREVRETSQNGARRVSDATGGKTEAVQPVQKTRVAVKRPAAARKEPPLVPPVENPPHAQVQPENKQSPKEERQAALKKPEAAPKKEEEASAEALPAADKAPEKAEQKGAPKTVPKLQETAPQAVPETPPAAVSAPAAGGKIDEIDPCSYPNHLKAKDLLLINRDLDIGRRYKDKDGKEKINRRVYAAKILASPLSIKEGPARILVYAMDSKGKETVCASPQPSDWVEITVGDVIVLLRGMIVKGEFKMSCKIAQHFKEQGWTYDYRNHEPNPEAVGHLMVEDDGIHVHLLPMNTKNNTRGFADFAYCIVTEDGVIQCNATSIEKEPKFTYKGKQMQIMAKWKDDEVIAGVGEAR